MQGCWLSRNNSTAALCMCALCMSTDYELGVGCIYNSVERSEVLELQLIFCFNWWEICFSLDSFWALFPVQLISEMFCICSDSGVSDYYFRFFFVLQNFFLLVLASDVHQSVLMLCTFLLSLLFWCSASSTK